MASAEEVVVVVVETGSAVVVAEGRGARLSHQLHEAAVELQPRVRGQPQPCMGAQLYE